MSVLKTFDEVFVYRIGKRGTRGHVAKDWGLETPLLTAVMTVRRSGRAAMTQNRSPVCIASPLPPSFLAHAVQMTTAEENMWLNVAKEDGTPVATCPIVLKDEGPESLPEFYAESVVDSSRYFVLRIVDVASQRTAFIGIGFRERHTALRFKETLQDHCRFVLRQRVADAQAAAFDASGVAQSKKFALAEGTKIRIAAGLPPKQRKAKHASGSGGGLAAPRAGGMKGLAPPRVSGVAGLPTKPAAAGAAAADDDDDDDWGDFQ